MQCKFPKTFFVAGTDTSIGKTVVSAILTVGLSATYWKPIQSGHPTDTGWIKNHTSLPESHFIKESYHFKEPLSPHLASELENIQINTNIALPNISSHLIIEGAGGLLVPLNPKELFIDLLKKWNIPVLLVTKSSLGTINHTLLSLDKLKSYQIPILGVVMNGEKNSSNKKAIETYGKIPVIAEISLLKTFSKESFQQAFEESFL